jgi:hypothetical protein
LLGSRLCVNGLSRRLLEEFLLDPVLTPIENVLLEKFLLDPAFAAKYP